MKILRCRSGVLARLWCNTEMLVEIRFDTAEVEATVQAAGLTGIHKSILFNETRKEQIERGGQ